MTTALSMAVKRYFEAKGDSKTDKINIAVPVNIRWEPYTTFDSVKMENKFAPMVLQLPLNSDAKTAIPQIAKLCKTMRNKVAEVYASYFIALCAGSLLPA